MLLPHPNPSNTQDSSTTKNCVVQNFNGAEVWKPCYGGWFVYLIQSRIIHRRESQWGIVYISEQWEWPWRTVLAILINVGKRAAHTLFGALGRRRIEKASIYHSRVSLCSRLWRDWLLQVLALSSRSDDCGLGLELKWTLSPLSYSCRGILSEQQKPKHSALPRLCGYLRLWRCEKCLLCSSHMATAWTPVWPSLVESLFYTNSLLSPFFWITGTVFTPLLGRQLC